MTQSSQAAQRRRDRALADACIAGNKQAWADLVTHHERSVRFAIVRTLQTYGRAAPDHLVEDLQAGVFLRLVVDDFRRLRQYRAQATLKSWLKVLASNATVDQLRRRRPTVPIAPGEPFDAPDPSPDADEALSRAQLLQRLRDMWDCLPPADAEFVELYFIRELSFDEIAQRTESTPGALYARKNRIRKKLLELAEREGWFSSETG